MLAVLFWVFYVLGFFGWGVYRWPGSPTPGFGADILVMHLAIGVGANNPNQALPAVVGSLAQSANPKRLVVSHIGNFDLDAALALAPDDKEALEAKGIAVTTKAELDRLSTSSVRPARCIASDQPRATARWSTMIEIDARSISARTRDAFAGFTG